MISRRSPFWAVLAAATVLSSPGLAARPLEEGAVVQAAAPDAPLDFEIYLPLRDKPGLRSLLAAQHTPGAAQYHRWLTPAQFAARFGPTAATRARVQAAATAAGLTVLAAHSRSLHVAGDADHVQRWLHTRLAAVTSATGEARMVAAPEPTLPAALAEEGARILAFADVPRRRPQSVHAAHPIPDSRGPDNRTGAAGAYAFDDLKQAYDYPAYTAPTARLPTADGTGVRVAILMSDLVAQSDIALFFNSERFTTVSPTHKPVPTLTTVKVDGGGVLKGPGSFEASLDVEQVLGGAPGSAVTLISLPDLSDQHILDGYNTIVEANTYDIVNSSFGGCELEYTAAYNGGVDYTQMLLTLDEVFQQGNAQGITFVASSGDDAGVMCPTANYGVRGAHPTFVVGVSTPADDPNVTAVGGGNLITSVVKGSLISTYVRESAYADPEAPYDIYGLRQNVSGGYWGAGGGVSVIFPQPAYQTAVLTGSSTGRTLPDVGMQVGGLGYSSKTCSSPATSCGADDSSVLTAYKGGLYHTIGTSVSSPEFVGALALYEQTAGRQGNLNPFLYAAGLAQTNAGGVAAPAAKQYYHRNNPGFNGAYPDSYPSYNYNYVYGNGSPDVRNLFGLTAYPPAGNPQTSTNP
jgi:subtilase family serine protease